MPQRGGGGGERRKRGGLVCLSLMFNFYFIFFPLSFFSLFFFAILFQGWGGGGVCVGKRENDDAAGNIPCRDCNVLTTAYKVTRRSSRAENIEQSKN